MKTKKMKYVDLKMRFNLGSLKYEPALPLKRGEKGNERNAYDKGWWKTLLKLVVIAVVWAGLVWFLRSIY